MTITQALQEAKHIQPIGGCVRVFKLNEGYEAIKYTEYPYGYEFEVENVLAFTKEDLHEEMRKRWGIEPNYQMN